MKPTELDLLLLLAQKGAAGRSVALTTSQAAKAIGVSQQTASRWLGELTREGLVSRTSAGLRLTSVALGKLARFGKALDLPEGIGFEGVVFEGMADGAYYMSQPEYKAAFKHLLGFTPFAGTLNLRLHSQQDIAARAALYEKPGLLVKEFRRNGHFFGAVKCFAAKVSAKAGGAVVDAAVIMPIRTHHPPDVLEIIAPVKLRDALGLKNGSPVAVEVEA